MQGRRPAVARWTPRFTLLVAALLALFSCGPWPGEHRSRRADHGAARPRPASRPRPTLRRAEACVIAQPEDLLAGSGASGQIGDVRLDNGRVAFVIEALDRRWGFGSNQLLVKVQYAVRY